MRAWMIVAAVALGGWFVSTLARSEGPETLVLEQHGFAGNGMAWPFRTRTVTVLCNPDNRTDRNNHVVVDGGSVRYGLNGRARGSGLYSDISELIGHKPGADELPALDFMIKEGLAICERQRVRTASR